MELPAFRLLVMDSASHALLIADGPSGAILKEFAIPNSYTPCGLLLNRENSIAYIPAVTYDDSGALFLAKIAQGTSYRLPVVLPHPNQCSLSPDVRFLFIADPAGGLYSLDLTMLKVTAWGAPTDQSRCSGMAADRDFLYTAWARDEKGLLAVFDHAGHFIGDYRLAGQPTALQYSGSNNLLIPFTTEAAGEEGLELLNTANLGHSQVIPIHTRTSREHPPAYPLFAALSRDSGTAYVVNEDSADISILDLNSGKVRSLIPTGRSLSSIYLLPDERFAVAGSNMFADITLIDLINERVLSMTDTERELLGYLAILPASSSEL